MSLFPMFLKLEGRQCLVVGAGAIAQEKMPSLLEAGGKVKVVAPQVTEPIAALARDGRISLDQREFAESDLDGVFLVIAATSLSDLNRRVFEAARARSILCNAVDDPNNCDFYYGSVVRRGDLQIAISTAGQSPALAQRLRKQLEVQFGPEYTDWIRELAATREDLFAQDIDPQRRKSLLHAVASQEAFDTRHAKREETTHAR
ncbi:MAG TPA: bifunctional precorrin-2 dehydrogenase/sirohydrochlorin ferrochelatase [Terriglobales bacterium]|jgi:precorrin-2 dehydrogenase/sirohydrochlorin ferrochelatase|nr:bifunctional precorrin-2 dehydrogenase/sirohydrochlorin ferrochelatase [Terriglobales bacterium]